jgi:hypothetical protein
VIQEEDSAWVSVNFTAPTPSDGHWVALFSPADFGYVIRSSRQLKVDHLVSAVMMKIPHDRSGAV